MAVFMSLDAWSSDKHCQSLMMVCSVQSLDVAVWGCNVAAALPAYYVTGICDESCSLDAAAL